MSRLFIELYLDEDVHVLVADLIRARGFQAITTRDAGQLHNTDPEQLAYAVALSAEIKVNTAKTAELFLIVLNLKFFQ